MRDVDVVSAAETAPAMSVVVTNTWVGWMSGMNGLRALSAS
jgi:hypothetical protein